MKSWAAISVFGANRLLIGVPRCLRVVPVQQVAQVNQRLRPAGRCLAPVEPGDHPRGLRGPVRIGLENLISPGCKAGQQLLTARILDKPGDQPRDVPASSIRSEHQLQQQAPGRLPVIPDSARILARPEPPSRACVPLPP